MNNAIEITGAWAAVESDARECARQNKSKLSGPMASYYWNSGFRRPDGMGMEGSLTRSKWDAWFDDEVASWPGAEAV